MARKIIETITDDITGEEGAQGVTFSLNGKGWEIDLAPAGLEELERVLSPFMEAGRRAKVTGGKGRREVVADFSKARDLDAIRSWARENGHEVADRGRVSQRILDAYDAAH